MTAPTYDSNVSYPPTPLSQLLAYPSVSFGLAHGCARVEVPGGGNFGYYIQNQLYYIRPQNEP